ncbi:hypothetical protein BYT27DRAFT_7084265 [Phlegmacium glaucopus]|nr:hypothetical protein BYT27DRAFT_7084265 [Phlegmacium glaucopus]
MGGIFYVLSKLFGDDKPDEYNPTNDEIKRHIEDKVKAEAAAADAKKRADESAQRELEARSGENEARQKEAEAHRKEVEAKKREEEAKLAAEQARLDAEEAKRRGEESEKREQEAKKKEEEAKRLADKSRQATLDAQKREAEANATVLETQKREAEARMDADEARKREEEVQKDLQRANFYLDRGIQPEVWPTEEEFQTAQNRIQYDPEKLHFAVCGSSGAGKSSLVNAFRGLKNNSSQAARTGLVETTMAITRYPDPREEMPYKRLVWFDCPGAGTLEIPGWQYFNQQGLFIFDVIILVYDTRFTQIDVSIIENCERFKIPLFIVRSKADVHIRNTMQDLGYDENDDDAEDHFDNYQTQARLLLIDTTRNNLEKNLAKAELEKHDVFIVSGSVICSLVTTDKGNKKTANLAIDEARLVEAVLNTAYKRRYGTQAPAKNHSTVVKDNMVGNLSRLALTT